MTAPETPARTELRFDDALELFADPHRRRLPMTLLAHTPDDEIAIPEGLTTDAEELDILLVRMPPVDLPKLESLGVIEWNRERYVVRQGHTFDELQPLLELIASHQDDLPTGWL